jgi:hypothetical protein
MLVPPLSGGGGGGVRLLNAVQFLSRNTAMVLGFWFCMGPILQWHNERLVMF